MKPNTPGAEIVSKWHVIAGRLAAGAVQLPMPQPSGAQRQAERSVGVDALPSAAAVDAHLMRHEDDCPSVDANPRFKSVPIDLASRAVVGRQAPLSGPPHTVPPSPLQTTASCRQTVQNPTP
jgi:hypothetical protein